MMKNDQRSAADWFVPLMLMSLMFLSASHVSADTVYLKRGGTLDGEVVEGESTIEVLLDGGSTTFNKSDIERIEKNGTRDSSKAGMGAAFKQWKTKASRAAGNVARQTQDLVHNAGKKAADFTKPVGRSESAKSKEKLANDSMKELQRALQKSHKKEQALAQQKRALKKDGFNIQ